MLQKTINNWVLTVGVVFIFLSACVKEYSFEGDITPVITDSVVAPAAPPWICPDCVSRDIYEENRWSFHYENSFLCGILDTAIVNPERTAFTFFGPSACSVDTGMIISVYLNGAVLNRDLTNIFTERGAFYYYDNVGQTHILISHSAIPFTIYIDSYNHQTRMAMGRFSGSVFKGSGGGTYVHSGKFKIRLM